MRITNKMMTSNSLNNISKNKKNMSILENQYSTQQKIQRPSEDPVVAVRSLKYRTNLKELLQYYEKNVPDAKSWMNITEEALDKVNDLLKSASEYCTQGATDSLSTSDRDAIVSTLEQYKQQIYQYANTDYAGRYVFTGYRTDTPLLFDSYSDKVEYAIKEPLKAEGLQQSSVVVGGASYEVGKTAEDYKNDAAKSIDVYRMRLSYDGLKEVSSFSYKDKNGVEHKFEGANLVKADISADDAYEQPPKGTVKYIAETGELIFNEEDYQEMKVSGNEFMAEYTKSEFKKDDIRPEHYFDCTTTDSSTTPPVVKEYSNPTTQDINYEISFSQNLKVNTLACDSITHEIGRQIDEILSQVKKVSAVETKLKDVEKRLEQASDTEKPALEKLKELVEAELKLEEKVMQEKFGNGMTTCKEVQNVVSAANSDLGSRYVRLEMTEERLATQKVDFIETLKLNDGVDLEDSVINFEAAKVTYNASLSAAAKIIQNSLLDFI